MPLTTAVTACFRGYADFSGRARRSEYWWWTLFSLASQAVLLGAALAVLFAGIATAPAAEPNGATSSGALGGAGILGTVLLIMAGLLSLALVLPGLAVTVRRLHDGDRSGWWILLSVVPLGSIVLLVLEVVEGTPGLNRHASSPRGSLAQAVPDTAEPAGAEQGHGTSA